MKLQKDVPLTKDLKETERSQAGDVYKAADTVYDCVELLFSVYSPILVKKPPLNEKGEKCTSFQSTIVMQL